MGKGNYKASEQQIILLTAAEKCEVKRYYIDAEAAVSADDDESGDDNDDDNFNVMEIVDAREKRWLLAVTSQSTAVRSIS